MRDLKTDNLFPVDVSYETKTINTFRMYRSIKKLIQETIENYNDLSGENITFTQILEKGMYEQFENLNKEIERLKKIKNKKVS